MKRLFFKIVLPLFILAGGLQSCVNLKYANNFASSSLKSVKNFEEIGYSFKQNCLENCQQKKINDMVLNSQDCDCKANEKADSVTLLIYNAVKGYLDGLTNLSGNNLTNYKMDILTKSLSEGDLKSIKIEKNHVEAYSGISNILLKAFTNKYRKNKIKEYIKAGNEPFKILINFLNFNLSSNLTGKLNVQKQEIKDYYFDLIKDNTLSTFEKRKAVEEYYQRSDKIDARQRALTTYSKELEKIAGGHQKLVDNIEKLNKDDIKEQLMQYASDIQDLASEFNKITK